MNEQVLILVLYSVGVLLSSVLGGLIPLALQLTHRQLQLAVSLVAGIMLGSALFHLLPHASEHLRDPHAVSNWLLLGLLSMFFLERFFCFHHHDTSEQTGSDASAHAVTCTHNHDHSDHQHGHALGWTGVIVGLTAHSLLNGFALAASVVAESHHHSHAAEGMFWPGFAVFIAVACHKPFDALTIGTLMRAGGESARKRLFVNGLFSLMVPIGVALFYLGASVVAPSVAGEYFLGSALAFSTGIFLCIALSDLLPELQFHSHDRIKLSLALLVGILIAWLLALIESH